MDWLIFSGVCFFIALIMLGISVWRWHTYKSSRRPIWYFFASMILCVFAWLLAESFLGFTMSAFYIKGISPDTFQVPSLFYPYTIILLILAGISAVLGFISLRSTRPGATRKFK